MGCLPSYMFHVLFTGLAILLLFALAMDHSIGIKWCLRVTRGVRERLQRRRRRLCAQFYYRLEPHLMCEQPGLAGYRHGMYLVVAWLLLGQLLIAGPYLVATHVFPALVSVQPAVFYRVVCGFPSTDWYADLVISAPSLIEVWNCWITILCLYLILFMRLAWVMAEFLAKFPLCQAKRYLTGFRSGYFGIFLLLACVSLFLFGLQETAGYLVISKPFVIGWVLVVGLVSIYWFMLPSVLGERTD